MQSTAAVFLFLLLLPAVVRGQSPVEPVSRGDVAVSAGWLSADRSIEGSCCSSWSAGLFKGVSAGYYWTDHLKTEAAVADPGTTEGYESFSERLPNGTVRYTSERHRYDGTTLSIARRSASGRPGRRDPGRHRRRRRDVHARADDALEPLRWLAGELP